VSNIPYVTPYPLKLAGRTLLAVALTDDTALPSKLPATTSVGLAVNDETPLKLLFCVQLLTKKHQLTQRTGRRMRIVD